MAQVTLDDPFTALGAPWEPVYPWSPDGWTADGSWLANPALLPADANPFSVANGVLTLSDFAAPADVASSAIGGLSRIGGQILTEGTFSQTYGYFEADIEMPAGAGEAGAFWLMPADGNWPPELDIAEVHANAPTTLITTLHDDDTNPAPNWSTIPDATAGFHIYAVDWEPDYITWYFDGQQVYQVPTPADMNQPMYLILSLNSGSANDDVGTPSPTTVGQMKIVWVHVYDSNPYTTGGALVAPTTPAVTTVIGGATVPPTSVTDPTIVTVAQLSSTLAAASTPTTFLFNGSDHNTVISNFTASDVMDFEMTSQSFGAIDLQAAADGHALINFDGNQISLPGMLANNLDWSNFVINGQHNLTG